MTALLVISSISWILLCIVQRLNFWTIMGFITTVLFCGRRVGYLCKFPTLCVLEGLGIFMTVVFQLIFHRFSVVKFLITVLVRAIFLGVAFYDITLFVYPKQKVRRDTKTKV